MTGHSLQSCKNLKTLSNAIERVEPKPKTKVYVPKQPIPKVHENKGKYPIMMDNIVNLEPETSGTIKILWFFVHLDKSRY